MSGKKGAVLHKWTDAERARLAEIAPGRSHDEIRDIMTGEFGDHFGGKRITAALKRYGIRTGLTGRFEKGNAGGFRDDEHRRRFLEAGRATRFKAGEIHGYAAMRKQPVGSERVDRDGYVWVKVADGIQEKANSNFRPKHVVEYERAHGAVPEGCNVVFADHDKRNFDPSNLVAVPRRLWSIMARKHLEYWDADSLRTCMNIARLESARHAAELRPRECASCGAEFKPRYKRQRRCDRCMGR